MAHSKYLRWLKEDSLTTKVAQRFVAFCDEDIEKRSRAEHFDAAVYEDAVKLVVANLEGKNHTISPESESNNSQENSVEDNES